jgi:hypothetical protein
VIKKDNSIYNSGSYVYEENTAQWTITDKGKSSATEGDTGKAIVYSEKMTVSGFNDDLMIGQYTKKENGGGGGGGGGGEGTSAVIEVTSVIGNTDNIATVKALIIVDEHPDGYWIGYNAASAPFKNGGFKLNLSTSAVPAKYLETAESEFCIEGSIIISNKNALVGVLTIVAYNSAGEEIGEIYIGELYIEDEYYWAEYIYADRDFTIKGVFKGEEYYDKFDCSFKKGWNIIYGTSQKNENDEYFTTTQKPSEAKVKWYYSEY